MKIQILILILVLFLTGCKTSKLSTTSSEIQYDRDFAEFVSMKWSSQTGETSKDAKFDDLNAFYETLKKGTIEILDDRFLRRPSDDILVAHYLNTKLKWNSFNRGAAKLSTNKVIERTLSELPGTDEMLAFYYKSVFISVLNNQRQIQPNSRNIDLDKLGLTNQESSILFLAAMRHLGNQMAGYSTTNFPDNCFRAHEFLTKMPTFNGVQYYDFEVPEFEDFPIEVDKRYPKVSFKERFIPEFESAKAAYQKCLETKK